MADKIIIKTYHSPCGELLLGSYGGRLCLCDWRVEPHHGRVLSRISRYIDADFVEGTSPVVAMAVAQLDEYFRGARREFDVPLLHVGTDFQKRVWRSLMTIPYGVTVSYGEMARRIGSPRSVRALANANGANPISILVPCHRVIGSGGSLTGYGGGLDAKNYLLRHEVKA